MAFAGIHQAMWGFYMSGASERTRYIAACMSDLGDMRLQHMDAAGIDMQILALTAPGVQVMDAATGTSFARFANDELAAGIRRHPTRFAGLAACAPQDPDSAAKEIQRGVNELGLKGVIINSHTQGEYLSDTKFWPICLPTCSNTMRPTTSVALPAVNGTMTLMGCLAGQSCAEATIGANRSTAKARTSVRIISLPFSGAFHRTSRAPSEGS